MRSPTGGLPVPTELDATLARSGAKRLVVCGLATDYCVKATALDGVRLGYETAVLLDAITGGGARARRRRGGNRGDGRGRGCTGGQADRPELRARGRAARGRTRRAAKVEQMQLHLVDATYELFRAYYSPRPGAIARDGRDVGAVVGLVYTLLALLRDEGATHVGCATDHVIRSFRNGLYAGYKTEAGVPAELLAQFPLAERAMEALGLVVWPMVEFEADDALATAADRWAGAPGVDRVIICTPDKDLAQCVQRRPRGHARPAPRPHSGRGRSCGSLGSAAGVDTRLPGPGRRLGRRLPGAAGMGRAVRGRRPRPLRAPRGDPRERRGVARRRTFAWPAQRHSAGPLVGRAAVPPPGHSRDRCSAAPAEIPTSCSGSGARRTEFTALCEELGQPRLAERPHLWRD